MSCRSCGRGCSRGCGYGRGPASCLWLRGMSKSARRRLDAKGGCAADMPAERACNVQARLRAASHAMNSRVSRAEHGSRAAKQPITSRASCVFRGPIHPAIAPSLTSTTPSSADAARLLFASRYASSSSATSPRKGLRLAVAPFPSSRRLPSVQASRIGHEAV